MPHPEARAARPEEAEAALQTLCAGFRLDVDAARPIFYGDPYYELSHKRVFSLPDVGLVSCLTIVPTVIRVGGVPVPAGGIAGVATRPEQQRRGYAAALMKATVPSLWDELGYPLSLLHPISAPFYRRVGWETASRALHWTASPAALARHAEAANVRPAVVSDWPAIIHMQNELTQAETGACVRDTRRWQIIQMPVPGRETYVYEQAGVVTGYVIWERSEILELLEMQGRTPEARHGLPGFLARQPEPLAAWLTSPTLLTRFDLPGSDASLEPGAMLRIVDLEAALTAVHAALYAPLLTETGAELTLQIADPLRPRNERPLRLTPSGITPGAAGDPSRLQTDILTLARLYFGDWLPSEAFAAGLLSVDAPATLALADRLFPLRQPYVAPLDQV